MDKNEEDKESVKTQIRALAEQIRKAGPSSIEWAPLEWEIAELIIEYSIRHGIRIPVVNYDAYMRRDQVQAELDKPREPGPVLPRRWRLDDSTEGPEEPYEYFHDFLEAIGEHHMKNPRFTLHPDIMELVESWGDVVQSDDPE